jgi:hypothetical protein
METICDIHDAPEVCFFRCRSVPAEGVPGGLKMGEGRRGMKKHAVPASVDPSSTKKLSMAIDR